MRMSTVSPGQGLPHHDRPAVLKPGQAVAAVDYFFNGEVVDIHLSNTGQWCRISSVISEKTALAGELPGMLWPLFLPEYAIFHNITSLSCRIIFLVSGPSPAAVLSSCGGGHVEVQVKGVKGAVYDNVLARLKIFLHKDSPRLTPFEIRRLHRQARSDIEEALAPFGYFRPTVVDTLEQRGEGWKALYVVTAGEPVR